MLWLGAVSPAIDYYQDRAERLRQRQTLSLRMRALVETLPALKREAEEAAKPGDADAPTALLTGNTDALAAAILQQRIDELAKTAGARIGSEEILPARKDGDVRAIGVRLTLTAPFKSMVGLLLALARSETPMVSDDIQIRGPVGQDRNLDPDIQIDASLTVTSWRSAKGDTP